LSEIGKPAVPLIIASFGECGDLGSREGMVNACVVDEALRMIVGNRGRMLVLRTMAAPSKTQIERTARGWAVWWFAEGYRQSSFEIGESDEDE